MFGPKVQGEVVRIHAMWSFTFIYSEPRH